MSIGNGELRTTPKVYDQDRGLFEHAYQSDNLLLRASLELDTKLDQLSPFQIVDGVPTFNLVLPTQFNKHLEQSLVDARIALETAEASGEGTWNEKYRLETQLATASVRWIADYAFMAYKDFNTRRDIVDGIVGTYTDVLGRALSDYDATERLMETYAPGAPGKFERDRGELRGVISELAALALINYDQVSSRLGITAKAYDDLQNKTDIVYYHAKPRDEEAYKIRIQVKTTRKANGPRRPSGDVFMLCLADYGPVDDNRLARLLVKHITDPRAMSEEEERIVLKAKEGVKRDLNAYIERHPGEQLPLIDFVPADDPGASKEKAQFLRHLLYMYEDEVAAREVQSAE